MAEPSARREENEWQDCNEFKGGTGRNVDLSAEETPLSLLLLHELSDAESANETGAFTSSTHFDENLKRCFQDMRSIAAAGNPPTTINEETTLKCDEIWNALTDNFGHVMPVDWSQSQVRSLHLSTLSLEDRARLESVNLEVSDDEDLREQMDMHSIIVSCINDEPLVTAEQVIEEIEELMQESPEGESEQNISLSDVSFISQKRSHSSQINEDRVRLMSALELNDELEDVETAIRGYSEDLIHHLALRDELEFEKEVKNSFISVLIDVQNRQKLHREMLKKKRKVKSASASERLASSRFSMEGISSAIQNGFRHTFGNGGGAKQYVTTVIPYERRDEPPSVQDLQIFTKILEAMRDESDKVPSLLTDYILKVLCPT